MKTPVVGLSPMDGVTDMCFRQIVDEYSQPDVLYTEFVPVEGIILGRPAVLRMLDFHKTKTPVFAQLFGSDPEDFYKAIKHIAKRNFAGIDINMGCPDHKVLKKGGGAALILNPPLAREIIIAVKKAVKNFANGKILVTVKTRTGYDKHNTVEWIGELMKAKPDIITVHGRTFVQKYAGQADWEEIHKAVRLAQGTNTKIYGNGDIKSKQDAINAAKKYGVDGVLIGRAALGNPWIFGDHKPNGKERLSAMIRHAELFTRLFPEGNFRTLRKHFTWYVKALAHSSTLKTELMKAENLENVKQIVGLYEKHEGFL